MSDPNTNKEENHSWWKAPWKFFVETSVAVIIFIVIGAAAVGLSSLVALLKEANVDGMVIDGLKLAEYGLFATDLVMLGRFLWNTIRRNWSKL